MEIVDILSGIIICASTCAFIAGGILHTGGFIMDGWVLRIVARCFCCM